MKITLAMFLVFFSACAGARVGIVAPTSEVPVSLSRGVRDQNGVLVSSERRQVVGTYKKQFSGFSIFYSLLPLTPRKNLSDSINEQVAQVGGDAVINLRVTTKGCVLNSFIVFNVLPIWPGCTRVFVEGDIIQVLPDTPDTPAVPIQQSSFDTKESSHSQKAQLVNHHPVAMQDGEDHE